MNDIPRLEFEAFETRRDLVVAAMEHATTRPAAVTASEEATRAANARDAEQRMRLALFDELFNAALDSSDARVSTLAQRMAGVRTTNANNADLADGVAKAALRDLINEAMKIGGLRAAAQAAAEAQTRLDNARDLARRVA